MKKLIFTLVLCFSAWSIIQAQISKEIANTAGGLETTLATDISIITDLKVIGTMDARDFRIIRDLMPALINLDISNVSITSWGGPLGTSTSQVVQYPANQIPTRAFYNKNFVSLLLPVLSTPASASISVGSEAFYGYSSINPITIPDKVTSVSQGFNYCNAFFNVSTNHTVFSSIDGVLYNKLQTQIIQIPTSKVGTFEIPNTVITIGSNTFTGCINLTKIIIPQTVTSINSSFSTCTNLTEIKVLNTIPPIAISPFIFSGITSTCILNVPARTLATYQATNSWKNFTTIQEFGLNLSTNSTTSVTLTTSTLNGTLIALGDSPVSSHGFCWNTTGNPTIADSKIDKGAITSTGVFTYNLNSLFSNTKYYVKSYATDDLGTIYGEEINFTTLSFFELTTNPTTNVLVKSATLNGSINILETCNITSYGFCWDTVENPTISNNKVNMGTNPGTGLISIDVSVLKGSTKYYVRTYATVNDTTTYATQQSFTTAIPDDYDITIKINGNGSVKDSDLKVNFCHS